jgi:hypothetical protein
MEIILDACSIINLINGDIIEHVLKLPDFNFYVGEDLLEEELLNSEQKTVIEQLLQSGILNVVDYSVSIAEYNEIRMRFGLGYGETICIAQCRALNFFMLTDDRKAKICAKQELDNSRVFGSLYIIRQLFRAELISCDAALESFVKMRSRGGFLPNMDRSYFCD